MLTRSLIQIRSHMATNLVRRWMSSAVPLTTTRYLNLTRKDFAVINDQDVSHFESIVGSGNVIQGDLDGYNTDWLNTVRGQSSVVLRPDSAEQVSALLRHCNERRIAVCPQGGNTGLVGGSNPVFDEVIISTSRMNKIISIDDTLGVLTCQAGCVLESLDQQLASHNLMMPLDLGAKGSCNIGGNVSTNAGGIRLLRYGSLHGTVLGLQTVLANGTVLENLNPLIKDNTGYDLKHLFIGGEGTLGIVTAATIKCPTKPNSINAAMISVRNFSDCLKVLSQTKQLLGEILSAFEVLDQEARRVVVNNLEQAYPLEEESPFHLLVETSGSDEDHDKEKLDKLLENLMETDLITDGTVARDHTQLKHMWSLRERVAEALLGDGYCFKYDISLPYDSWYRIVEELRVRTKGTDVIRVVGYGHLGDGNVHVNVTTPVYSEKVAKLIEPFIYDWTAANGGSVSAEHGLGFKKSQYIYHSKSKEMVAMMKVIKNTFDPNGILNPYKYLPDD